MDALKLAGSSVDAATAVDRRDRILEWNHAAEDLLGFRRDVVLGQRLHEVVAPRDLHGNFFAARGGVLRDMVLCGVGPNPFRLDVLTYHGDRLRVDMAPIVVLNGAPDDHRIVYLIRRSMMRREGDELDRRTDERPPRKDPDLSHREIAVLRLIANGETAKEIAGHLHISAATVRNHTRSILTKLEAGKQTEAVAMAIRNGII